MRRTPAEWIEAAAEAWQAGDAIQTADEAREFMREALREAMKSMRDRIVADVTEDPWQHIAKIASRIDIDAMLGEGGANESRGEQR